MELVNVDLKFVSALVDEDMQLGGGAQGRFACATKVPRLVRDQYSAFRLPRYLLRGRGSLKATGHLSPSPPEFRPHRCESTSVSSQAHPQILQLHAVMSS